MEQDEVINELQEYATSDPPPKDRAEALATTGYLSALNNICWGRNEGSGMQRLEKEFSFENGQRNIYKMVPLIQELTAWSSLPGSYGCLSVCSLKRVNVLFSFLDRHGIN